MRYYWYFHFVGLYSFKVHYCPIAWLPQTEPQSLERSFETSSQLWNHEPVFMYSLSNLSKIGRYRNAGYAPCVNVHWLDLFNNLQPGFWLSATKQPSIRNSSNGVASGSGDAMWEDLKRFPVHEMPYILFYFQLSRIFIFKCLQGLCDPV